MSDLLDRIYTTSPVFVQNTMATAYGLRQRLVRNRGAYSQFVTELERQQWMTREQLQDLQNAALRRTVEFAAREVPYYRELFAREGIRPEHVKTVDDLRILPFLDKATVQREGERLRPDRRPVKAIAQTTGGTTGKPVPYYVTPRAIQFNYATFETRCRQWAGVTFGDRLVSINGKPIVPMNQQGPPYWRHNLAFNQLYVSAYHLSDANLGAIVERIAAFKPRMIVAYVSAVHRIAKYINAHGLIGQVRPRGILVSSETLHDWQRADIERAFSCKVFNGYSLGEPVCFASECPQGGMHISVEYGVIELVDGPDGPEIVATGLINDAMPMLRYRTGDRVATREAPPCSCGRGLPTIGPIIGRVDEMVVTPEGTSVGPAALSLAFQSVPNLKDSQIEQSTPQAIKLRIEVTPQFDKANEQFLIEQLRKRLGLTLAIDLEYVSAIPKTVSGKQRLIVSSVRARP